MVLLMSMVYCDQKATAANTAGLCRSSVWSTQGTLHSCVTYQCTRASQWVHHTLPSPSSMCDIFDLFHRPSFCARGARKNCTGDVSPANAGDKNKKTGEPNSLSSPHVDIEGLVRRQERASHGLSDRARKMLSCGEQA